MGAPLWLNAIILILLVVISLWLFYEGFVNIKTGRITKFGIDFFFYRISKWMKNQKGNWDDSRKVRISGIIAIVISLEMILVSLHLLIQYILPRLK
jgi:hypothetical protein